LEGERSERQNGSSGLKENVIDEAGLVDPSGDREEGLAGDDFALTLHGVTIDDGRVDDAELAVLGEQVSGLGHEALGAAFTAVDHGFDKFEGIGDRDGRGALARAEVAIARAESEAIGVASGGGGHNLDQEIKVGDEFADDSDLLGVLLAEDGDVGLNDVEEFGDDGGDAAEMGGAGYAFKGFGDGFLTDVGGVAVGVEFLFGGTEDVVGTGGLGFDGVALRISRVLGGVFAGAKLSGVDENGDDDDIGTGHREANKIQMPLV